MYSTYSHTANLRPRLEGSSTITGVDHLIYSQTGQQDPFHPPILHARLNKAPCQLDKRQFCVKATFTPNRAVKDFLDGRLFVKDFLQSRPLKISCAGARLASSAIMQTMTPNQPISYANSPTAVSPIMRLKLTCLGDVGAS